MAKSGDSNSSRFNSKSSSKTDHFSDQNRGSGFDKNSDESRLSNASNLLDRAEEDSFPASDPISALSPTTGMGRHSSSELPADFKDNKEAQFAYGRRTEQKTLHFDTSSHRLNMGNPDIGEVDLGTIEADQPAQKDDNDHYDVAGDGGETLEQNRSSSDR